MRANVKIGPISDDDPVIQPTLLIFGETTRTGDSGIHTTHQNIGCGLRTPDSLHRFNYITAFVEEELLLGAFTLLTICHGCDVADESKTSVNGWRKFFNWRQLITTLRRRFTRNTCWR